MANMLWLSLLLLCCVCLFSTTAQAAITNSATARATVDGNPVQSLPANASVPVAPAVATVAVAKTAVANDGGDGTDDPGDSISYTFTVTNTGDVSLAAVTLADPMVTLSTATITDTAPNGDSSDSLMTPAWDVLGPGDILTYTATHILTPTNVGGGILTNTATANATTIPGAPVTGAATVNTNLRVLSTISLVKTAVLDDGGDGIANAGDEINYSFLVTNTGTVNQNGISISDPLLPPMASLPGRAEALTMMAAAASGADPVMTASTEPFDPVKAFEGDVRIYAPVATQKIARLWPGRALPPLAVGLHVERKLVMLSGDPGMPKAGDRIGIYFDLVNTGEGPLTNISVDQVGAEAFGDALDILAPNTKDSASIIFSRLLTAEDITSGVIAEPALLRAYSRDRAQVFAVVDDLPLSAISGMEELATASINPTSFPQLTPGQSTTFTATLILTQTHIDAGVVNNTAQANSTDPFGADITAPGSASTLLPAMPGISLIKDETVVPGIDGIANAGDTITYAFTIKNTGNVTLLGITLADTIGGVTLAGGPIASLAPNAVDTTTFTASYTIQQTDLDVGYFDNQASVTGNLPPGLLGPDSQPVTTDLSDDNSETENDVTRTDLLPAPAIALIKLLDTSVYPNAVEDVNGNNMNDLGDIIHYTFQVQNTGNVTLTDVNIVDRNPLIAVTPPAAPPTAITLAPEQIDTTSFTAQYTIIQDDMDRGSFNNTADAYGTDPNGTIVEDESDPGVFTENGPTVINFVQQPSIALLKQLKTNVHPTGVEDANSNNTTDVGDIIHYAFTVINNGNVTLSNITLSDNNANESGGPIASLLPGTYDDVTFTATHVITTQDMDDGEVRNRARVNADTPSPSPGISIFDDSDPSDVTEGDYFIVPLVPEPAISVVKRFVQLQDTNNSGTINAGDTIFYDIDVRNTGNVPLTQVTVNEQPGVTLIGGPTIPSLEAGDTDTTTFSATRVLDAADITATQYSNSAEATGIAPDNTQVDDSSDESVFDNDSPVNNDDPTITSLLAADIAVTKFVINIDDENGNSVDDVGDIINYGFTVTNIGNSPLTNITLTDSNGTVPVVTPLNLTAGQSNTGHFTASHVITLNDLVNGAVSNQAEVNGDSAFGPVQDLSHPTENFEDSPTITPLTPAPAVALMKQVTGMIDVNGNGLTEPGDTINYTFTVFNIGNTVLNNFSLVDNIPGVILSPIPVATLNPGGQFVVTGTYVVTNIDASIGLVSNTAVVRADAPLGDPLDASDDIVDASDNDNIAGSDPTETVITSPPAVLTKAVAKSEIIRGEQVEYTLTASSLLIGPYTIIDMMPPGFDYVDGSATVNTVAATPVQSGNTLTFASIDPNSTGLIVIKLKLRASVTIGTGSFVNRAELRMSLSGQLLATAQVPVLIKEEHIFDCGDIIGRVFDDLNANGYVDDGEPGMPGVRVVTVKGILITTDKHGRFHVPCADIPNSAIGSNFLMKLDTRTLPAGYVLTTENPRDVRLTRGKAVKLNFGVSKNHEFELELKSDAFTTGVELHDLWLPEVERLMSLLEQGRGALNIVYRCGVYEPIIDARLETVKAMVETRWRDAGHDNELLINTKVECGK